LHLGFVREVREEEWEVGTNALFVGDSTEVEIPDDSVLLVWICVWEGQVTVERRGRSCSGTGLFLCCYPFCLFFEDSNISTVSSIIKLI
jgi:hypothetical protein